jgi:hypothetical protein
MSSAPGDALPEPSLDLPRGVEETLLRELRIAFEAGDRTALLKAIAHCGRQARVMPEWVVAGYCSAMNQWWSYRVATLDEAFGVSLPKGKHIAALRKRRRLEWRVYSRVMQLQAGGRSLNKALFAEVGAEYAIGKTLAEEYYAHAKESIASAPAAVGQLLEPLLSPEMKHKRATRKITKLSGTRSKKAR